MICEKIFTPLMPTTTILYILSLRRFNYITKNQGDATMYTMHPISDSPQWQIQVAAPGIYHPYGQTSFEFHAFLGENLANLDIGDPSYKEFYIGP